MEIKPFKGKTGLSGKSYYQEARKQEKILKIKSREAHRNAEKNREVYMSTRQDPNERIIVLGQNIQVKNKKLDDVLEQTDEIKLQHYVYIIIRFQWEKDNYVDRFDCRLLLDPNDSQVKRLYLNFDQFENNEYEENLLNFERFKPLVEAERVGCNVYIKIYMKRLRYAWN